MKRIVFLFLIVPLIIGGCSVSYQFTGASIDYTKTKSIEIKDFVNRAPLVYPPLAQVFNEGLKDHFNRMTKLSFVESNADLELEGEITRYDLAPMAVKQDAFASETRLTMTVRMRYRNNVNPEEDKEETFSAYRDFSSDRMLADVQDELIDELTDEIVKQIFNTTVSDW